MRSLVGPAPQRSGPGRWGFWFAALWLFYLFQPLQAGWAQRDTVRGWVGIVTVVVFGAGYVSVFFRVRSRPTGRLFRAMAGGPRGFAVVGALAGLDAVACLSLGQVGTTTSVYVAVMAVLCLGSGWAWVASITVAVGTYLATVFVPGWHADSSIVFGTLVAALAIWGIQQTINRSAALLEAREENARLAVEDERNRLARDLHDILGHSLTVITVKAELANRLLDVDTDRARSELDDLERLSRDALADVRRAVEGYRDLTLPGELARAREALAAADIDATLPNSTDDVPSGLRELFAWTVREGITNVLRHSGASTCTVRLSADRVEIEDDGHGPVAGPGAGHGLLGLRERAVAAGAVLVTRAVEPHGFLLEVVAG